MRDRDAVAQWHVCGMQLVQGKLLQSLKEESTQENTITESVIVTYCNI